jgi:hypothetical protein
MDGQTGGVAWQHRQKGGGCGVGFGVGWGFFLLGYGVVAISIDEITGKNDRLLQRAVEQLDRERAAGLRPPLRPRSVHDSGPDPIVDRIIRHIESRRAMRQLERSRN